MLPTLFAIGSFRVDTYYVVWGISLCAAVFWIRRRCVSLYSISYDDASDVLFWTLIGVIVGAMLGGYLDNWGRYAEDPKSMLYFWRSGMSSGPGFLGGGIAGLYKLRRMGLSAGRFADAASVPSAFMLAVGRWGCFGAGCCAGIPSLPEFRSISVVFPSNIYTPVYPTQLFESAACFVIGSMLFVIERRRRDKSGGVLWPLFLLMYGSYRMIADFIRDGDRILGLRVGQYSGIIAVVIGAAWLYRTQRRSADSGC